MAWTAMACMAWTAMAWTALAWTAMEASQPPHLSSLFIHVREKWHKVHTALFSTGPSEDLTPVRQARTPDNKRTLESANLVFSCSQRRSSTHTEANSRENLSDMRLGFMHPYKPLHTLSPYIQTYNCTRARGNTCISCP